MINIDSVPSSLVRQRALISREHQTPGASFLNREKCEVVAPVVPNSRRTDPAVWCLAAKASWCFPRWTCAQCPPKPCSGRSKFPRSSSYPGTCGDGGMLRRHNNPTVPNPTSFVSAKKREREKRRSFCSFLSGPGNVPRTTHCTARTGHPRSQWPP